ncbi:DUF3168 domain-containing protein [Sphaerisporangium sp. NPDC004334]
MSAIWAVQRAVYARLAGDADLGALIAGVFDEVPEAKDNPYVAFAEITEKPMDTHDRKGWEVLVTLNVWSAYRGFGQSAQILGHLDRLLDRVELEVDGWELVSIARVANGVRRVADPNLRQGQARYRVWLTEPR